MSDIIKIYWMQSTIHPTPFICDPKTVFVPNMMAWESFLFLTHPEVLLFLGVLNSLTKYVIRVLLTAVSDTTIKDS